MNKLIQISFQKLGYGYDFLTAMCRDKYPDGYLFKGEAEICLGLRDIRKEKARIVVMPDFDVDGVSSGAVLYAGLSLLGFRVSLYEPDPANGYGIKKSDIDNVMSQWPDAKAILTCDVGAGEEFAVAYASACGLRVYVTDHHIEKPGHRVEAIAVMDPCRYDEGCEFKGVCGAWVAWHLLMTYAKLASGPVNQELCRKLVVFAGLGSCGDLMPVLYDTRSAITASVAEFNRLLDAEDMDQYFGCPEQMLPEPYAALFTNLRALHYFLVDIGKVRPGDVTDETYGYTYCPMINSVRRMGEKMSGVYAMLFKRHAWNSLERLTLFRWLADLNESRKSTVQNLYAQLEGSKSQALAPYIYLIDAAPGVLGLLAAKLMDRNGAPCLVLRPDKAKGGFSGSGRIPSWMDYQGFLELDGCLKDGHDRAFGAFVPEHMLMAAWKDIDAKYRTGLAAHKAEAAGRPDPRPVVCVGGHAACGSYDFSVTSPSDMDVCLDYGYEILKFRPFGNGFREPEFVLSFLKSDIRGSRTMGSDRTHLRLDLGLGLGAVWFGGAWFLDEVAGMEPDACIRLAGTFGVNEFNGSVSVQFMVSGKA